MLNAIGSICDRLRRKHSIARRQKRREIIAGRLTELQKLEVELETFVLNNLFAMKDNMVLIKMFYAEIADASKHFKQRQYRSAKKSRGSARTVLLCIKRNSDLTREGRARYIVN